MSERVHLRVRGHVQGVAFRAYAQQRARELDLSGWIRNRPDGSVEAIAEGEPSSVEAFEQWCRTGPPAARVKDVDTRRSEATGEFKSFVVAPTA